MKLIKEIIYFIVLFVCTMVGAAFGGKTAAKIVDYVYDRV
jgi:hypothetical protein